MPRKPALLLHLLNLVLGPIAGQTSASSNQRITLPQYPPAHDREAWEACWKAQGQAWRTEPEIDVKRQEYLAGRCSILPNIEQGVYPFKDIKLNRADVEWLLATHENGLGPVDWNDVNQRGRYGLDLRGAYLPNVDLSRLPLARTRGGLLFIEHTVFLSESIREAAMLHLEGAQLHYAHLEGSELRAARMEGTLLHWAYLEDAVLEDAHLEGAIVSSASLEGANLVSAHLEKAFLNSAHLEGAALIGTHLEGSHLEGAFFDRATLLEGSYLGNKALGTASLADVQWGEVNLAVIDWSTVSVLGDERVAQHLKLDRGGNKSKEIRLTEYQSAVRANRQLAIALQSQGLNEAATHFAYCAQMLQKTVFRLQLLQSGISFRRRMQSLSSWLSSWSLFLIAGYGYRPSRSFLTYLLVICSFATTYYLLGHAVGPVLSPLGAFVFSMTSFHGRGFFPGNNISLDDPLTVLAALEALVGLIIEVTFIATLTQRFFNR